MTDIKKVLSIIFESLTKDTEKFFDWYDYKTAKIEIDGELIGIGIAGDSSAIKLFIIKPNNGGYGEDDYRKFTQTFRIGIPQSSSTDWGVELAQSNLRVEPKSFSSISNHFIAATKIIEMIEKNC